ncbi:Metallo-dependent phosphatase-like protein [Mycena floridula]|nr:Metallo-dependent phosphatase-like protein [Mycena floridula]
MGYAVRFLRSIFAPLSAIIGFSCLLTFLFILYQPTPGPGSIQRLGWQSWDVITMQDTPATSQPQVHTGESQNQPPDSTVDWWNVSTTAPVDTISLPLDEWGPLLPHDTGLSEITATRCIVEQSTAGDLCAPASTTEQDAIKGKWVRVERNLNLEAGYWSGYLNIYYRRTRRQDIDLVTDIRLLPSAEEPYPLDGWTKVALSMRSGVMGAPPLYMWYRVSKPPTNAEERAHLITELDVLYGDDIPWYGFEKISTPTLIATPGKTVNTWITFRRGVKSPPSAPPLHFSRSGKFKILQIADLHFSVGKGTCKDTKTPCSNSDDLTASLLASVLEKEKPDLVVFSGDQLNGQARTTPSASWDPKSVLAKFSKMVAEKKIPWAAVFGNHDSELGASRAEQMQLMKALPYSVVEPGPKDVHGVGNYVLKIKSADASKTQLLTLYFLDSGSYSKGYWNFWGAFTPTAYDWIHQTQIDWFLQESAAIKPIERPFTPDTGKDLGHIWTREEEEEEETLAARQDQVTPMTRKLAKPNALMFFHIPLPASYSKADTDARGKALDVGVTGAETPQNSNDNDKFFEKGILKAMESDHVAKQGATEVKVVANGHCHLTENCRRVNGVWLCFGGGGSYSGYGKIGFDRRFRIYDISDYGETIRTYKRTEKDEIVDQMMLSGRGAPAL